MFVHKSSFTKVPMDMQDIGQKSACADDRTQKFVFKSALGYGVCIAEVRKQKFVRKKVWIKYVCHNT